MKQRGSERVVFEKKNGFVNFLLSWLSTHFKKPWRYLSQNLRYSSKTGHNKKCFRIWFSIINWKIFIFFYCLFYTKGFLLNFVYDLLQRLVQYISASRLIYKFAFFSSITKEIKTGSRSQIRQKIKQGWKTYFWSRSWKLQLKKTWKFSFVRWFHFVIVL